MLAQPLLVLLGHVVVLVHEHAPHRAPRRRAQAHELAHPPAVDARARERLEPGQEHLARPEQLVRALGALREEQVEPAVPEVEHVQVQRGDVLELPVGLRDERVGAGQGRDLERGEVREERARALGGGRACYAGPAQGERRLRGLREREGARGGEVGEHVAVLIVFEVECEGGEGGEGEAGEEREEVRGLDVGEDQLGELGEDERFSVDVDVALAQWEARGPFRG